MKRSLLIFVSVLSLASNAYSKDSASSVQSYIMEKDKIEEFRWFYLNDLPEPLFQPNKDYMPKVIATIQGMKN